MAGISPFQSPHGAIESKASAPLGVNQTYGAFDPVRLVANQLTESIKDGSPILVGELLGFAATPATGALAGSRTAGAGALEQASPAHFGDVGAAENTEREYIRLTPGQLFQTRNFFTTVAATTQDVIGGSDLGGLFQISGDTGTEWGLVDAAAVVTTDVAARVVKIYDVDGNPFNADTADTQATGTAAGPLIVFEIANVHELTQVMGG